jgi:3-dehydroquinate synthase
MFEWFEQHGAAVIAGDTGARGRAVEHSCITKATIVGADEREAGARALLNFGHTFGHAIEAATGFGPWLHGEAVAAGMVMAAELSARAGLLARPDAKRISALISRAGLPIRAPQLARERWHELISLDKKSAAGRVRFVLLDAIGRASLRADVDPRLVDETIAAAA